MIYISTSILYCMRPTILLIDGEHTLDCHLYLAMEKWPIYLYLIYLQVKVEFPIHYKENVQIVKLSR